MTTQGGLTLLLPPDVDGVRRRNSIVATNPLTRAPAVLFPRPGLSRPGHDSGPSAVLQSDTRGCPVTETLKCVIKVLKLYFWVHRTLSIFLINWFQWTVESAWGGRENSFRVGTGRYGPSHLLQPSPLHLKLWDEHKDECTPLCTPTPSPSLKREE